MTDSESRFRQWFKKRHPGAVMVKLPDFKQLGLAGVRGLPDYVVFRNGETVWYEVKKVPGKTLNLISHFTPDQRFLFGRMSERGVGVKVFVYFKGGFTIIDFYEVLVDGSVKLCSV